jgi:hypothetical protein
VILVAVHTMVGLAKSSLCLPVTFNMLLRNVVLASVFLYNVWHCSKICLDALVVPFSSVVRPVQQAL